MSDQQTVGQHLDDVLSTLATKDDLKQMETRLRSDMRAIGDDIKSELRSEFRTEMRATADDIKSELRSEFRTELREHTRAIVAVVNDAIEGLRVDLNAVGVPVRTTTGKKR